MLRLRTSIVFSPASISPAQIGFTVSAFMAAAPKTFPCPKCNRTLRLTGELTVGGRTFPAFSCDECIVDREFDGEMFPMSLTFCVDDKGQPFDPADPDGRLRF